MKGRVYVEYRRLGFFAVETEDNDFSIIEVGSGIPSLGDELIGGLIHLVKSNYTMRQLKKN